MLTLFLQLVLLTPFVMLVRKQCMTGPGLGPIIAAVMLGLTVETTSFALVNYVLSLGATREGQGWFEAFATVAAVLALILLIATIPLVAANYKSSEFAQLALTSAQFLVFTAAWNWSLSHVPQLNWF